MEFTNIMELIKYIRNEILDKPTEEYDGDDLEIRIYDNEISFAINEVYGSKSYVGYSASNMGEVFACMEDCRDDKVNIDELIKIAAIAKVLRENQDMIKEFLINRG